MTDYYELLDVRQNASSQEIKSAFRERAKRLHPDIAGETGAEEMRKLLAAYEILSDRERRFEYDRAYSRFAKNFSFDYRDFLRKRKDDPASQAKLLFFELLNFEEESALSLWQEQGGLDFQLEKYLDREDWMDCTYILAEELAKKGQFYESFVLLVGVVREERRRPYFRHFMEDVENFLKELVRLNLRSAVDAETYVECLEALLDLGFSPRDEARWMRSMAETLLRMGETRDAEKIFREALKRDPGLPNTVQLRRKLRMQSTTSP
jgi:tetratricopeptide (TPR) repeat protein